MIDRQDDMIFSYQLCKKAFAKNPETVFNLPYIDKVLMNIVCEQKGGKAYTDKILEAIYERSGGLSEDDTDLEVTPIADDKFLHDICCILDSRKWILPKSFPPTVDNIELYFEKNLLSLERVFYSLKIFASNESFSK